MVRQIQAHYFKPPWPFFKKGNKGIRKIGPAVQERRLWPGQKREFPELSPNLVDRFKEGKLPLLSGYHGVQPEGYTDPNTGAFVKVPEMVAELVVPDLTGFKLKPYVSYRTDVEIQKREKEFEKLVTKKGMEKAMESVSETDHWPPPKVDARLLFDMFYMQKVKNEYVKREKEQGHESSNSSTLLGSKMRIPLVTAKRSLHTTISLGRGPVIYRGWFPRDHKPGPYPKDEKERKAAAMKYGLRPEDYKPIDPDDHPRYSGDYPDLGVVTFAHRDPYEDYSYRTWRRNWNEPVIKEYLRYRPDRYTFTGLDSDNFNLVRGIVLVIQLFVPLAVLCYFVKYSQLGGLRWKNNVMPKQYAYDYHRSWPLEDPLLYPIVNYSFEPAEQ